ncbi:MAG: HpcH/HpaI aldolase [Verrucomicrobia bacterium]|nr:HpcH/HpaI aldolase [Verrucomicrobiota bacterium]
MKKNHAASLQTGGPKLGLGVMYPSPGAVERIGSDWDWIWVDGQHGQLGYQEMLALVRACDLVERPAVVRVASHEGGVIGQVLDMGAAGVIVPLVNTVEQARALVKAAKFPPLGERSYGGRRPVDLHGRLYSETANVDTLLVAQIETPEALGNAEAIAAVPGIDALFFGPDDVMLRRGLKMDQARPIEDLRADLATVATACGNHGKIAVTVGANPELMALCLALGYRMVVGGSDAGLLSNGSKQASAWAREAVKGNATGKGVAAGIY